jgi:acetyl esterase
MVDGFDDEDGAISCRPNALVLFNPCVDTTVFGAGLFGDYAEAASPLHHVKPGLPPTLILHGAEDEVIPLNSVLLFQQEMTDAGNRCELKVYEDVGHGFFNPGREPNYFGAALSDVVEFLESLGYLTPAGEGGPPAPSGPLPGLGPTGG